jgi:hypothetical protein
VKRACGSSLGKTFVSEAAARTIGLEPLETALASTDDFLVGVDDVVLEPLPQPTTSPETPITMSAAATRRAFDNEGT